MAAVDRLSIDAVFNDISHYLGRTRDVFAVIGALFTVKLCAKAAYTCYRVLKVYLLPKVFYVRDFQSRYGQWAVVTGASEGIGRSYSIELAKRGMNVILISRSNAKLEKVAALLEENFKVKTKIISADLNDIECYDEISKELQNKDIGVLVNNVGVMYDQLQYFLTVDSERLQQIINLNIMATVLMSRTVLPGMVSRKRGAIINLSSGACVQPVPCMTAYSAAKKYIDYFSQALNYEYGKDGITVQSVQPFYVSTRMTNFVKPNFLVPDAESYVDHALKTLSFTNRTYGYWSHGLMGFVGELLPQWLFYWCTVNINIPMWNYFTGSSSKKQSKKD